LPTALRYQFEVDERLSTVRARVCFEGQPPARLVAGVDYGHELLREAIDVASGRALAIDDRGAIDLNSLGRDGCVDYIVDLGSPRGSFGFAARRIGDALVSNATLWLWRPRRYAAIEDITASFVLPAGVDVAVAWPREGDRYRLDASAFAFYGHAVFGRFERERVHANGTEFDVAVIAGLSASTRAVIAPWLRHAATSAAIGGSELPFERVQIVVVPVEGDGSAMRFGHVGRGGGRSIALLVNRDASLDALRGDWTLVHEISHLYHPFVKREDLWLREGLATYYQELFRARAGTTTRAYAWQRLWDGAAKGRVTNESLAVESARVLTTFQFPLVYWGGATFALLADIELRQRSEGVRSLDEVMLALAACCSTSSRPWTSEQLLARMDEIAGGQVFTDLAKRVVLAPPFPDLHDAFAQLGIEPSDRGMRLLSNAPLAHVRDAIMAPRDVAVAGVPAQR
jgi:hypothetical protein